MRKLSVIVLILSFIITGCSESNNSASVKSSDSAIETTTLKEVNTVSETTTTKATQTNSISDSNNFNELIIGCWKETQGVFTEHNGYIKFVENGIIVDPITDENDGTYSINGDSVEIDGKEYEIAKLTTDSMHLESVGDNDKRTLLVFVRQNPDVEENNKALLRKANSNAKLIFTTLNNKASDFIADNETVNAVKTNEAEAVESFRNSADPLKTAVYEAVKDSMGTEINLGYAYISFDPNNEQADNFVQWSETNQSSIIGQYPNPVKSIDLNLTFGTKH